MSRRRRRKSWFKKLNETGFYRFQFYVGCILITLTFLIPIANLFDWIRMGSWMTLIFSCVSGLVGAILAGRAAYEANILASEEFHRTRR